MAKIARPLTRILAIMKDDIQTMMVKFNNAAAKIYSILFKQFSESVHDIDRSEEENVFKMQAAKFIQLLKYRLDDQAKKILETSPAEIHDALQTVVSTRIDFYLQEFQLKCKAL